MTYEPTERDWEIADKLRERLESMDRVKARSIVTSLITCSPAAIQAAQQLLTDGET